MTNELLYTEINNNLYDEFDNKLKEQSKIRKEDDFYTYINEAWIEKEKKKKAHYYVQDDDFRISQDEVYHDIMNIIEESIKNNNTLIDRSMKIVIDSFYSNSVSNYRKTIESVYDDLNTFKENSDLTGLLAYMNKNQQVSWCCPLHWSVAPNEKNVEKAISHLAPCQLGIYDYSIYFIDDIPDKDTYKYNIKNKYLEMIEKLFKSAFPKDYKNFNPNDIWDIEKDILNAFVCKDKSIVEDKYFCNEMTREEIYKLGFEVDDFMVSLGYNKDKIPKKYIVSSINYLKCITKTLKENWKNKKWQTYFIYLYIRQYSRFHFSLRDIHHNFYGKVIKGQEIIMEKRIYPVFLLSSMFNKHITDLYLEKHYDQSKVDFIHKMFSNIRHIYINKIKKNKWLSKSAKEKSIHKLGKIKLLVAKHDEILNDMHVPYEKNIYKNLMLISEWATNQFILTEGSGPIGNGRTIDWNEFKMTGMQTYIVNAFYTPTMNAIYIPQGIIQPPFFDLEKPIEYNLAAIGFTLGHEISHSLDNTGSHFDWKGNLNEWWSRADRKNYDKKIKDVVNQYETFYKYDGLDFNAENSVGEDIADINGFSIITEYLFYLQKKQNMVPELQKNSFYNLFIYSAILSKQYISKNAIEAQMKVNPHPLEKYRTNCTLSRNQIFKELLGIKKKDKMWWNSDTIW